MTNRFARAAMFATLAVATTTSIARADTYIHYEPINMVNRAQNTIWELYITPTTWDNWGSDQLGQYSLIPDYQVEYQITKGWCTYDIQAVFMDGTEVEYRDINLCTYAGGDFEISN